MQVELIRSAIGDGNDQFLSSTVINHEVAIDAGCIGFVTPLSVQHRLRHVLLSHSHLDHVASLPVFLDNVYSTGPECPTVYGTESVWDSLQTDLFNGRVWPDLPALSTSGSRFLQPQVIAAGVLLQVGGLQVMPVELAHTVPTVGFVIEDANAAVAFVSDTSPTEAVWEIANKKRQLKAIFLEASFPSRMSWLAQTSMHLTPSLLAAELTKVKREVRVIVVHTKAAYRQEVEAEIAELDLPGVELGVPGEVYRF